MRDPYDEFEAYSYKLETEIERRPVCDRCKEHIQEDVYRLDDELLCRDCALEWLDEQKEEIEEEWD